MLPDMAAPFRGMATLGGAHLVLAVVVWGRPLRAEEAPIDLDYRAYEGCPSVVEFTEQVTGRAEKTVLASERWRGRKFIVTVSPRRSGATGRLVIDSRGDRASREVEGTSCREVVAALALFTALAIDPNAQMDAPAASESSAAAAPPPVPPAPPAPALPVRDATVSERSRSARGSPVRVLAGLTALDLSPLGRSSTFPPGALGGALFGEITTPSDSALTFGGRLSVLWVEARPESARFRLIAARLDLCPLVDAWGTSWSGELCAAAELGGVRATAQGAGVEPTPAVRFWGAADALGRVRWSPGGGVVFLELEGGATMPLTRYDFSLGTPSEPQGDVHQVPPLGWVLGWGVGGRIL